MNKDIMKAYQWPPDVSPSYESPLACGSCDDGWIIERQGKYGVFWGCTNYPRCKRTMNAEDVAGALGLIDPDEMDYYEQEF